MELTEGEKSSILWEKLFVYFTQRLESNRIALECAATEKDSDKLRGRIAEDKLFIGLNEEIPDTGANIEV